MTHRWRTLVAIDSDRNACATYRENFPGVPVRCGPVRDFIAELPVADVVVGGPPCQPFSAAGRRNGPSDDRDGWPEFTEAVRKVRPRMFLAENVPGLLSKPMASYFASLIAQLEVIGYTVETRALDAVHFGAPQFRRRVWVWGVRNDLGLSRHWPPPTHAWPPTEGCMFGGALLPAVTVRDAIGLDGVLHRKRGKGLLERSGGRRDHPTNEPAPTVTSAFADGGSGGLFVREAFAKVDNDANAAYVRIQEGTVSQTLELVGGRAYADCDKAGNLLGLEIIGPSSEMPSWKPLRRLTPIECGKLQTLPTNFRWPPGISKTAQYRIIGNGWASVTGAAFARAFAQTDPGSRTMIDLFCGGGCGAAGWHGQASNPEKPDNCRQPADKHRPTMETARC